jgi:glutamate racemase
VDNRRIGVFDSGVGGLSVLREIKEQLPKEGLVYVADQKEFPYGGKTDVELQARTEKIVDFLIGQEVKLVVVACNTATVYALEYLRAKFSLPLVGVVPVIKTLSEVTKTKKVGVISTPATSKSDYLNKLIKTHTQGLEVYNEGASNLEEIIETGDLDDPQIDAILEAKLGPMKAQGIDALALGCTHYPFLKAKIEAFMGPKVQVLDPSPAIGRQVKRILENNDQLALTEGEDYFYTTGSLGEFKLVAEKLLQTNLQNVRSVQL